MEVKANGDVQRTEDEWRAILARWEKSGISVPEFCKVERIALSTFRRWHQVLGGSKSRRSQFVPLTVASPIPSNPAWTLEVELPNGAKLRMQG